MGKEIGFIGTSLINQPERTAAIFKKVKESKAFKVLQREFFPYQELEVKEAFNLISQAPGEREFDVEGIILVSKDRNVVLTFTKGTKDRKPLTTANALVITDVRGSKVIQSFDVNSKNEISFEAENIFEGTVREELIEELEKPLFPTSHNEVESQVQGFTFGCLWGGYRWCGKGCYNYPDIGGDGSYINSTDLCCKNHDYCYKNNYLSKKQCDTNFCGCLKGKTNTAANLAKTWYCIF